ncbi:MAG: protein-L-isoaspartate O-methyltransferase [Minisyncoccia bacterium]
MTKEELINSLINDGYLKTESIIDAFKNVDRLDFVSEDYKKEAYGNYPLPIGYGQTISQPLTVAFMLELLNPKVNQKILDIGTGSGWQAALLGYIVGENGRVITIERIPGLVNFAEKNINKYKFIDKGIVKIIQGNGINGYVEEAPYDGIIAAATSEFIPVQWKQQVKINGKIVAPVNNSIVVLEKVDSNKFIEKSFWGFSFVPLINN